MAKNQIIVGNWKMYKTAREASAYLEQLIPLIEGAKAQIFLAVPYTSIASAAKVAKGTEIRIGAQNMNDARDGAFTGEIAALMLKEAGAEFVLLGHSERRSIFGETNEFIQKKVVRALQDDLIPILCVGETTDQRALDQTEATLRAQIEECLKDIPRQEANKLILAYEPVWAIGSGKTATPALVQEVHSFCRSCLIDLFGEENGTLIPILYGGSVNTKNIQDLLDEEAVDGVLVGGASLDPEALAEMALITTKETKQSTASIHKKTSEPNPKEDLE